MDSFGGGPQQLDGRVWETHSSTPPAICDASGASGRRCGADGGLAPHGAWWARAEGSEGSDSPLGTCGAGEVVTGIDPMGLRSS